MHTGRRIPSPRVAEKRAGHRKNIFCSFYATLAYAEHGGTSQSPPLPHARVVSVLGYFLQIFVGFEAKIMHTGRRIPSLRVAEK